MTEQQPSSTYQIIIGILLGIIILGIGGFLYQYLSQPSTSEQTLVSTATGYVIDQKVSLTGTIKRSSQPGYTFTLNTPTEVFGVKSRLFSLNQYLDSDVAIEGSISDLAGDTYVITIVRIDEIADAIEIQADAEAIVFDGDLLINAGIIITKGEGWNWTETGVDTFAFTNGEMGGTFSSFLCDESTQVSGCLGLAKMFGTMAGPVLVTADGVRVFSVTETKSFFATNDKRGYYINPNEGTTYNEILSQITFITPEHIQQIVQESVSQMKGSCPILGLSHKTTYNYNDAISIQVTGTLVDGRTMDCTSSLEQLDEGTYQLTPFRVGTIKDAISIAATGVNIDGTDEIQTQTGDSKPTSDQSSETNANNDKPTALVKDMNVTQIALKGSGMEYAAKGGFVLTIPTNIVQYAGATLDSEEVNGLRCFLETAITDYQQTGERTENSAIRHLVCRNDPSRITELKKNFFVYEFSEQGHIHLVQVRDPAWYDVAAGITISYPDAEEKKAE